MFLMYSRVIETNRPAHRMRYRQPTASHTLEDGLELLVGAEAVALLSVELQSDPRKGGERNELQGQADDENRVARVVQTSNKRVRSIKHKKYWC